MPPTRRHLQQQLVPHARHPCWGAISLPGLTSSHCLLVASLQQGRGQWQRAVVRVEQAEVSRIVQGLLLPLGSSCTQLLSLEWESDRVLQLQRELAAAKQRGDSVQQLRKQAKRAKQQWLEQLQAGWDASRSWLCNPGCVEYQAERITSLNSLAGLGQHNMHTGQGQEGGWA